MTRKNKVFDVGTLRKKRKTLAYDAKWHKSLRVTSLIGFIIFVIVISYSIYYAVKVQAKAQMIVEFDRLAVQVGGSLVNELVVELARAEALAKSQAVTIATAIESQSSLNNAFPGLFDGDVSSIIKGGSVWVSSHFLNKGTQNYFNWEVNEYDKFVFERADLTEARYLDRYGLAAVSPSKSNQCVWGKLFLNNNKKATTISCSVRVERNGNIYALSTVSLDLTNLAKQVERWQERINGYIFIVDRENDFVSFPNELTVLTKSRDKNVEVVSMKQLAFNEIGFAPLFQSVKLFDEKTMLETKNNNNDVFESYTSKISFSWSASQSPSAEKEIYVVLDPLKSTYEDKMTTLIEDVSLKNDHLFKEASRGYIFHVPSAYWKLAMIMPIKRTDAVANTLSTDILKFILVVFGLSSLLGYYILIKGVIFPLEEIVSTLRKTSGLINQKRYLELGNQVVHTLRTDEVGLVRQSVNELIERVARNEGEIAATNILLEEKVNERTHELITAMNNLKRSQTDLVSAEKMATLGQMVAGVAHEVNTPLGYVKNNVLMTKDIVEQYNELIYEGAKLGELLASPSLSESELRKTIDEIVQLASDLNDESVAEDMTQLFDDMLFGVDQISELVVNLKNFARVDKSKVKNIDIHECVESSLNIVRSNLKKFEIIKSYQIVPKVFCSPSQINQVFLNLLNNASQAIESKNGIISIETSNDDEYVFIKVIDNGKGMSKEVFAKIFQPFYTTKGAGEGTGLGLAISQKIIEQHKGKMWVTSAVGKGTCFTVCLPVDNE